MLAVAKVARGRAGYYLAHLAPGDAASGLLLERPGRWIGGLAAPLGLEGREVDEAALARLLEGRDPAGAPLHRAAGRVAVAAFDLTFTVPKSVSLLHALAPTEVGEAVAAAHGRAVEAGFAYLAANAAAVRRRAQGSVRQRPASGLLAAAFVHRTSRASEPHLHTHVVLVNVASDADGRRSALDARPLYLHLRSASALCDAELRARLTSELGVSWRPRAGGYDLAGLPEATLAAFSTRSAQIAAELERSQRSGRRAAAVAAARTRPAKDRSRAYPVLVAAWREAAYDLGIADGRWRAVLGPVAATSPVAGVPAADLLVAAAGEAEEPFTRRQLLVDAALRAGPGVLAATLEAAADAFLAGASPLERLGERPALLATEGRPLPAGRAEPVFRTERLGALERSLAAALAPLGNAGRPPGTREAPSVAVLAAAPGRHLESLEALAARGRAAAEAGLAVRAHAPAARDAAAFEALTGIPTSAGARVPLPAPGGLLVVAGADRLPLATLEGLLSVARARRAPLALVLGPPPLGRARAARRLLGAVAEPLGASRWVPGAIAEASTLPAAPSPGLAYAPSLAQAVAAALAELARRRGVGERAVLVAPDRQSAAALERLVPGPAHASPDRLEPIVHLAALAGLLERREVDSLVVLGAPGAAGLGRPAAHLAVAPLAPLERPFATRARLVAERPSPALEAARLRLRLLEPDRDRARLASRLVPASELEASERALGRA